MQSKKHKKHIRGDLGIGLLFLFSFIGLGLLFVLLFRPLYLFDLRTLRLPELTGYSEAEILQNYDYLIRTCLPFYNGTFQLPTLPSSDSAIQHFADVRLIFYCIYAIAAASILALIFIIRLKKKNQDFHYLKVSGILVLALPAVLGVFSVISFHTFFMVMHQILFRNDFWLFDPVTDPIIDFLPEEYFLHCAAALLLFVMTGGVILLLRYRHHKIRNTSSLSLGS